MHRSGLEAALLQPAHDLVLGEADVRFDPHIWDPSALHVRLDRLAVNLQHRFEVFRRQHIGQNLEACECWALGSMASLVRTGVALIHRGTFSFHLDFWTTLPQH